VPYSVLEAVVWSGVVYFTVGLAPSAGRLVIYLDIIISKLLVDF